MSLEPRRTKVREWVGEDIRMKRKDIAEAEKRYTPTEPGYLQLSYWAVTFPKLYQEEKVSRFEKLKQLHAGILSGSVTLEQFMIEISLLEEEAYELGASDERYYSSAPSYGPAR